MPKAKHSKSQNSLGIFSPDSILKELQNDVKSLKQQARTTQAQVKEEEALLEKESTALDQHNSRDSQRESIKGKELLKLSRLKRMGFEEGVIREHLEAENKKLDKLSTDKRKERMNLDENIKNMKEMNEQSERAVSAVEIDVKGKIGKAKKLKEELDEAEVKLYALERKVKHSRETKGIGITNKGSLREGIKGIVSEVRDRCADKEVVRKVMKVAGRCLANDIEMSSSSHGEAGKGSVDDESVGSVEISDASSEG